MSSYSISGLIVRARDLTRVVRDHFIIGGCCDAARGGAFPPPVVIHMGDVMDYVLSQDGELVKVDERGYEYTGMYIVGE